MAEAQSKRCDAERLISAGLELIAERGLYGFSLADIASRTGTSKTLVNHHFTSKDNFLDVLMSRLLETPVAIEDVDNDPLGVAAVNLSNELVRGLADDVGSRARLSVLCLCHSQERRREMVRDWWRGRAKAFSSLLADGTKLGVIKAGAGEGLLPIFLSAAVQGALLAAVSMKVESQEKFRSAMTDAFISLLAPSQPGADR